jgi:hypothetical protein
MCSGRTAANERWPLTRLQHHDPLNIDHEIRHMEMLGIARCKGRSSLSHAIIVSTAPGMEPWLDQCLKSLRPVTGIPVIIYRNTLGTGEGESLRQAALYTQYDEVIFLHDTMELLDPRLIDYCFTEHAGKSIGFMGGLDFGMNSGKFKPAVLRQMRETVLRVPKDKQESADMELAFGAEYQRYEPEAFVMPTRCWTGRSLSDDPLHGQSFEPGHGQDERLMKNAACVVMTTINPPTPAVLGYIAIPSVDVIIVADRKTPEAAYDGLDCAFLSLARQRSMAPAFDAILPHDHYARKNMGYLYAIRAGCSVIVESDDDNIRIIQGLADGDPDVDAIFRLTSRDSLGPLTFERSKACYKVGPTAACPVNTQNTVWRDRRDFHLL